MVKLAYCQTQLFLDNPGAGTPVASAYVVGALGTDRALTAGLCAVERPKSLPGAVRGTHV